MNGSRKSLQFQSSSSAAEHHLCLWCVRPLSLPLSYLKETQTSSSLCSLPCQLSPRKKSRFINTRVIMTQHHRGRRLLPSKCWAPFFSLCRHFLPWPKCPWIVQGSLCLPLCYRLCTDTSPAGPAELVQVCWAGASVGHTCCQKQPFTEPQCGLSRSRRREGKRLHCISHLYPPH